MKTSDAEKNGGKCPECGGRTTQDLKHRGYVRHIDRPQINSRSKSPKSGKCRYGRGERD